MINISEDVKLKLQNDTIYREIKLVFPDDDFEITGENIISESFELENSINDEKEFKLGGCIASEMSVQVININQNLIGKKVDVYLKVFYVDKTLFPSSALYPSSTVYPGVNIGEIEFQLFSGIVDSAKCDKKNRSIRKIVAFDVLYSASRIVLKNNFAGYYLNGNKTPLLGDFARTSFTAIDETYNIPKVADNFNKNTMLSITDYDLACKIDEKGITQIDIIKSYCELNSTFGIIDRTGKFKQLILYKDDLIAEEIKSYSSFSFEDYETADITQISFSYYNNKKIDYGARSEKTSRYIADNNCITKVCTDVFKLIKNFYINSGDEISNHIFYDVYKYQPMKVVAFNCFWIEPGDKIKIRQNPASNTFVESFVFSRKIKGVNGMKITLESKGPQYMGKEDA